MFVTFRVHELVERQEELDRAVVAFSDDVLDDGVVRSQDNPQVGEGFQGVDGGRLFEVFEQGEF